MVAEPRRRGIRFLPRAAMSLLLAAGALVVSAAPAAADVTDGLVLRYDLSQTSGSTATDTSGRGRDGALSGDASFSADGALQLGGTNGYVKLPNNVLTGLSQITVSADVFIDPAQATP